MPATPPSDFRRHRALLDEAERLRAAGKLVAAEKAVEQVLAQVPPYFAAWSLLGRIHKDAKNPLAAATALQRAAMLDGGDGPTLVRLAEAYIALRAMDLAAITLRAAEALTPDDPNLHFAWGQHHQYHQVLDAAIASYDRAAGLAPSRLDIALPLGEMRAAAGRDEEAYETLRDALQRAKGKPSTAVNAVHILYALAANPHYVGRTDVLKEADAVERLAGKMDRPTAARLAFARGRALDAAGRFEEAWRAFQLGNEIIWAERAGAEAPMAEQQEELALREVSGFQPVPERPLDPKAPIVIFLVGPSRSGKSTLERMIGRAFGEVQFGYEAPLAEECTVLAATRTGLPQVTHFQALPSAAHRPFGELLAQQVALWAAGRRILTNTHPGNIHHAGGMVRAYSNAFFVFVRRDLEDNAIRCYQRLYSSGNAYSYRLSTCRSHLAWYAKMSDAWTGRLPGRSLSVVYEEMVADPAAILRRLGEAIGMAPSAVEAVPDDRGCSLPYRQRLNA